MKKLDLDPAAVIVWSTALIILALSVAGSVRVIAWGFGL